ncbi:hypothetical protein [Methylobacterium sp. J-092]|uniref:hypothetical protein n=1 Tax=Methylobacterium sp. J-092 TaxID=2836667 RepID=UPI001FB98CA9|nr:hypothetical protein [Methylobacterium sp. J-092]MCJ2007263.1 hypothetical protein [Methylobacterium sp. J-092]
MFPPSILAAVAINLQALASTTGERLMSGLQAHALLIVLSAVTLLGVRSVAGDRHANVVGGFTMFFDTGLRQRIVGFGIPFGCRGTPSIVSPVRSLIREARLLRHKTLLACSIP